VTNLTETAIHECISLSTIFDIVAPRVQYTVYIVHVNQSAKRRMVFLQVLYVKGDYRWCKTGK